MNRRAAAVTAVLLFPAAAACDRAEQPERAADAPAISFDTAAVRIETATDTFRLTAELAETPEQRAHGLMERTRLPEDHGMLFLYPEPQDPQAGFYMYRTRIPLDIAFVDSAGRIVAIRRMEPCPSPYPDVCRIYSPGAAYTRALEVNRGYFQRRGIGVGDRVVLVRPEAETP